MSVPTESGWYWARLVRPHRRGNEWEVVDFSGGAIAQCGEGGRLGTEHVEVWGSRVPDPVPHYGWRDPLLAAAYRFSLEMGRELLRKHNMATVQEMLGASLVDMCGVAPDRAELLRDVVERLGHERATKEEHADAKEWVDDHG